MPLPKKGKNEDHTKFMSRCMSDPKLIEEFGDEQQRLAVCINQSKSLLERMDDYVQVNPWTNDRDWET